MRDGTGWLLIVDILLHIKLEPIQQSVDLLPRVVDLAKKDVFAICVAHGEAEPTLRRFILEKV